MLKTNSIRARQNVINWVMNHHIIYDENDKELNNCDFSYNKVLHYIYNTFKKEMMVDSTGRTPGFSSTLDAFNYWCKGLPNVLCCEDFLVNNDCKDVLGDILEESQEERKKYNCEDSENLLILLIYREIIRAVKCNK